MPIIVLPPPLPILKPAKTVAVYGAGVAGLTAAHELVERGYAVEVYECAPPSPFDDLCSLGGMARTQWTAADRVMAPPLQDQREFVATRPLDWRLEEALKNRIRFKLGATCTLTDAEDAEDLAGEVALCRLIDALLRTADTASSSRFEIRGFQANPGTVPSDDQTRFDVLRAVAVREAIREAFRKAGKTDPIGRFDCVGWGLGRADTFALPRETRAYVSVHALYDYIPGEHGYRFFPTFYRNLRDTLKRIPIADDRPEYVETPRTVFDNLVPTTSQGVNFAGKDPYVLPRRRLLSAQEFFDLLVVALRGSKFTLADTNRLAVKTFKFMTSCRERRKQYENISWWDFIGGEAFSPAFQKLVQHVAQAFVAMTVKECDARTYGDVSIQLYRDQFIEGERIDAVLNGPTSVAWFGPWRRYLESQGVRFFRGKVVGFEISADQKQAWPVVALGDDIEKYDPKRPDPTVKLKVMHTSYHVLALNIEAIHELAEGTYGGRMLTGRDFEALRDSVHLPLGKATDEKPQGVLRHLTGLQFFTQSEFKQVLGHSVYPDADWGLSSVYQPQFWMRKRGWWDGYRGVLSVCIGKWHADKEDTFRSAWQSTHEQIARETWRQIVDGLPDGAKSKVPTPTLYHIDANLIFDPGSQKPAENTSRMFVNLPGTQAYRPGVLWRRPDPDPGPTTPDVRADAYDVWYGNIVLAGTYMQTFTRLTTMEAANESARHAVNAILDKDGFLGDRCAISNPEDHELPDLEYLVDLDAELMRQGLPHFVDILDVSTLTKELLSGELNLTNILARGAK